MSQENVETVRRLYDAWEANDFEGVLACLAEDLVTRRLPPMPDPGTWRGPEGLIQVAAEWMEAFDEFTMNGEAFTDAGEQVVVRVAQEGRGAGGGVLVTGTFWFAHRVSNAKVVTFDMYASRREALEAVGLSE